LSTGNNVIQNRIAAKQRLGQRMASNQTKRISTTLGLTLAYLAGVTSSSAQGRDISEGFAKCKIIADDQTRLNCLKDLLPKPSAEPATSTASDSWPLVRTPHPKGGPEAVSIMRTADTALSDPDLAGLMIRCKEGPGLEVQIALVRPFPPHAKRDVVITSLATPTVLHAEASPVGTALVLPIEAAAFTTGPLQGLKELAITIRDPEAEIHGVIPLGGLTPAVAKLSASCPSG
jgi:hypothetical protein